jgi:hypothetical protein
MPIRITVDCFSGRPNPSVVLHGREADEIQERLTPQQRPEQNDAAPVAALTSRLGYRGVVVEALDKRRARKELAAPVRVAGGQVVSRRGLYEPADVGFEDFVCGSTGPLRWPPVEEFVFPQLPLLREWWQWRIPEIKWPKRNRCACGPLYEPDWWNVPGIQWDNNCYNYGTNYRTNTFAQPGKKAGAMYQNITGPEVLAGAVADRLIDNPGADNRCPDEGHLVALVIAPGWDFHWYRKGRNGMWSHKPGGTPVTNLDNAGVTIPDPRTADRGPYTEFTTFMTVMHGHIAVE